MTMTEAKTAYIKPLPRPDALMRPFWENAREKRLVVHGCRDCGHRHFPASPVCPNCLSENLEWVETNGEGELVSWVEFHKAYWDSFAPDLPYLVGLVRLDAGPSLYSNIVDVPAEKVSVGQRVRVVFDKVTEDFTLPKFVLVT